MRDLDLRMALNRVLDQRHADDGDTVVRQELGLCAGHRRIDVAVINGEFAGFEIKSDEDTLVRLAGQAEVYGRVLDRVTLVTTDRYVNQATSVIPTWWGIAVASQSQGQVQILEVRPALMNEDNYEPFALAQLLWRDEALAQLRSRGLDRGLRRKARHYIWLALAEALDVADLRAIVRQTLKERRDWPGGQLHEQCGATGRTEATV